MDDIANVGLVIDFTDTRRYYDEMVRFNNIPIKKIPFNLTKFAELRKKNTQAHSNQKKNPFIEMSLQDILNRGVDYVKLSIPGKQVPPNQTYEK